MKPSPRSRSIRSVLARCNPACAIQPGRQPFRIGGNRKAKRRRNRSTANTRIGPGNSLNGSSPAGKRRSVEANSALRRDISPCSLWGSAAISGPSLTFIGAPRRHGFSSPPNSICKKPHPAVAPTARPSNAPRRCAPCPLSMAATNAPAPRMNPSLTSGSSVSPKGSSTKGWRWTLRPSRWARMASSSVHDLGISRSIVSALVLPRGSTASAGQLSPNTMFPAVSTSRTVPSPPLMTSSSTPLSTKRCIAAFMSRRRSGCSTRMTG